MNSHFAPGGTLASVFLFLASGGNSLGRSVLVGLLGTEFTEIDFRYRISGIAFTVRDFRKWGIPSSLVCEFQAATAPIAALETGMRLAMLSSVFIRLAILSSVLAEFCLSFTAKG
ncbi:hypothetical protein L1987_88621 [Smallanthus sonchifolius]|nr:hypothetical protein L1987_89315 [Smallanthus sonchifolius]KAI3666672.1 hypothetical protein L1987_88794 [Smallanthus sonchifolius]KAI3668358.1 hypothetical protein L1987_88650 [Smallanthus sonchifolius]KAI3668387.1 hypothetical protein L1987_88621 [Smallanthus sonchifolius]